MLTEDSDLIVFMQALEVDAPVRSRFSTMYRSSLSMISDAQILFKMDEAGSHMQLQVAAPDVWAAKLDRAKKDAAALRNSMQGLTRRMFVQLCILIGCDYLPSIGSLGPKTAIKAMRQHKGVPDHRRVKHIVSSLQRSSKRFTVSESYVEEFLRAEACFFHQIVWNHAARREEHLTPVPEHLSEAETAAWLGETRVRSQQESAALNPCTPPSMNSSSASSSNARVAGGGGGRVGAFSQRSLRIPHPRSRTDGGSSSQPAPVGSAMIGDLLTLYGAAPAGSPSDAPASVQQPFSPAGSWGSHSQLSGMVATPSAATPTAAAGPAPSVDITPEDCRPSRMSASSAPAVSRSRSDGIYTPRSGPRAAGAKSTGKGTRRKGTRSAGPVDKRQKTISHFFKGAS